MFIWFLLLHTPPPKSQTSIHLDLIRAGRKWRFWEAMSGAGIFQSFFCLWVYIERSHCAGGSGCTSGIRSPVCPLSKHHREGFLQCPAGTHIPQASPALTGLGFTYLILNKYIWARKITVLAASPFTREWFFHLQAATCVLGTRDSVRTEKHRFLFFFSIASCTFPRGALSPLPRFNAALMHWIHQKKAKKKKQ